MNLDSKLPPKNTFNPYHTSGYSSGNNYASSSVSNNAVNFKNNNLHKMKVPHNYGR